MGSKGWQEGEPCEPACHWAVVRERSRDGIRRKNKQNKKKRGGEAKLITTHGCIYLFGHKELGKAQLPLSDLTTSAGAMSRQAGSMFWG